MNKMLDTIWHTSKNFWMQEESSDRLVVTSHRSALRVSRKRRKQAAWFPHKMPALEKYKQEITISTGEGEDLRQSLLLPCYSLGKPVQVDGVDVLLELHHHAVLVREQVPFYNLMVFTTGVDFISCDPAHTTDQFCMYTAVKANI